MKRTRDQIGSGPSHPPSYVRQVSAFRRLKAPRPLYGVSIRAKDFQEDGIAGNLEDACKNAIYKNIITSKLGGTEIPLEGDKTNTFYISENKAGEQRKIMGIAQADEMRNQDGL